MHFQSIHTFTYTLLSEYALLHIPFYLFLKLPKAFSVFLTTFIKITQLTVDEIQNHFSGQSSYCNILVATKSCKKIVFLSQKDYSIKSKILGTKI